VPSACATPDFEKDVPRREKGRFTQSFASPIALADQVDDPLVKRRLASPKELRLRAA